MLKGEHGRQKKELDRLINWLGEDKSHDDVVVLSNVLLSGLAPALCESLSVPVVCLLQDEEGFVDDLAQPYRQGAWDLIRENLPYISAFVSVSRFYAGEMQKRLSIDGSRIHVVYAGVEPSAYELSRGLCEGGAPTVGFLSQMCAARGLAALVAAFTELKQDPGLVGAKLRIAGGMSAADKKFVASLLRKLEEAGLSGDVEVLETFDFAAKIAFLKSLTVLSVPEKERVACGLYAFEAWAAAVPVVQPCSGVFPELFERAGGGGILYDPLDKTALCESLRKLLKNPQLAAEQGAIGRRAVEKVFNIENSAEQMISLLSDMKGSGK
jgi:glycosyltransferase involved in cell wall biosynthesis